VGTKLDTSEDAPYLECAYKLMEYAGKPRMKKSRGKATMPGRKQVFRRFDNGVMSGDTLTVENDPQEGVPLIGKVMEKGVRLSPASSLKDIAAYTKEQYKTLPESLKNLSMDPSCPVRISSILLRLQEETAAAIS